MVSLDEEIQKDKQKHRGPKPNRSVTLFTKIQQSRGNDNRTKKFNRGPNDKHRGIRKDDRGRGGKRFRQDR